jgi:hypothetical protein
MRPRLPLLLVLAALLALPFLPAASAHTTVTHGNVNVKVGWLNEPPLVGQANRITIEITDANDQPILNVTTLTAKAVYGGGSQDVDLEPSDDTPGLYLSDLIPSQAGQYSVQLGGTVNGTAFPDKVGLQEVQSVADLEFPKPTGDPMDALTQRVAALEAKQANGGSGSTGTVSTSSDGSTLAMAALGLAGIALVVALAVLAQARKLAAQRPPPPAPGPAGGFKVMRPGERPPP